MRSARLKYFRVRPFKIAGIPVEISRTGYTGDLGYEIWVEAARAPRPSGTPSWRRAGPTTSRPRGMLALDVARIEAGPDPARRRLRRRQEGPDPVAEVLALRDRPRPSVHLDKAPFIGQAALRREAKKGPARQLVGLDVDWTDVERLHDEVGLAPQLPATASRASVPVYRDGDPGGEGHEHDLVARPSRR